MDRKLNWQINFDVLKMLTETAISYAAIRNLPTYLDEIRDLMSDWSKEEKQKGEEIIQEVLRTNDIFFSWPRNEWMTIDKNGKTICFKDRKKNE